MTLELLCVLFIGILLMLIPISAQMKWYSIPMWKSIVVSVVLALTGVVGSEIWYFVENLSFGGRSFYGAIVFSPIIFWPASRILRISYTETLDFVAPAGCMTLALVKLQCLRDGCCIGKILYMNEDYIYVRFPSQIIEMITFLIIAVVLLLIVHNEKNRGTIFFWFLILYGATRFILDFFRETTPAYLFGLSAGSFWSMWSCIIGITVLFAMHRKKCRIHSA